MCIRDRYEDVIRIKKQNDSFDDLRMEFAQMLRNQLAKGNNGLIRTKYITSVSYTHLLRQIRMDRLLWMAYILVITM